MQRADDIGVCASPAASKSQMCRAAACHYQQIAYLGPCHHVREKEEANHGVREGLDAASVNVLLLVAVQKVVRPALYLSWRPVLACMGKCNAICVWEPSSLPMMLHAVYGTKQTMPWPILTYKKSL